jgi:hypothetical protein
MLAVASRLCGLSRPGDVVAGRAVFFCAECQEPFLRAGGPEAKRKPRYAIQQTIAELGCVPPIRETARRMEVKGFQGNHQTIFKDYAALSIDSGRARTQDQNQLSLLLYAPNGRQDQK